jgi:dihydroorotase
MPKVIKIPASLDPHVHFRTPGFEYKEDWATGSKAALAGGVTAVIDMPNNQPPILTIDDLRQKEILVKQKAKIDYYFNFGTNGKNLEEIKKIENEDKVLGLKVYLNETTGNLKIQDEDLENIFKICPKLLVFHAEQEKVDLVISLAKKYNRPVYFCHISLKSEIKAIKKAKTEGVKIYTEVTPHHLFLTEKDSFKMKPSLKTKEDQEALWQGISEGIIDTIGTDHAPHLKEENAFGVPGIETKLPLLLDAHNNGKISMEKIVELTSINTAKIFGIKIKGEVEIDLDLEKKVENKNLFTKCGWSPWDGKILKGWPIKTVY